MEIKVDLKDYLWPKIEKIFNDNKGVKTETMVEELYKLFEDTASKIVPPKSFPDNIWPAGVRMKDFLEMCRSTQ